MKKFVALIATAILASLLLAIPTSPASADTGACFGTGTMYAQNGLYYPMLGPKRSGPFAFAQNVAPSICVTAAGFKQLFAQGTVNGWCGLASGLGVAFGDGSVQPQNFWFIGIGGVLIVGGHITGVAVAVPFPPALPIVPGESCLPTDPTGANNFLITGAVVKNHVVYQVKPLGKPWFPLDALNQFPFPLCPNPPFCPPV